MEEENYKIVDPSNIRDQLPEWDQDWEVFEPAQVKYDLPSGNHCTMLIPGKQTIIVTLENKIGPLLKMKELKWYYHEKRFEKII